jgi:hypothetical protein
MIEARMRSVSPFLIGLFAALSLSLGCSAEPVAPPGGESSPSSGGTILTSFDRLSLSPGVEASFRASLVGAGARLSTGGLAFVTRAPSVARVVATNGRAQVQGLTAGRTWVVVQSAAVSDSVEVIVE